MHAVWPVESWNVPPAQGVHSTKPLVLVKLPGAHGVGVSEPVVHAEPDGHGVHSLAACRFVLLE